MEITGIDIRLSYSKLIPTGYKYFNEDELERNFINKYGNPFSYRVIGEGYPHFEFGKLPDPILTPDFHGHSRLLVVYLSASYDRQSRDYTRIILREKRSLGIVYCFAITSDFLDKADILEESNRYHDIILFSHHDSYINLTLTVLSFFNYFANHQIADYIIKTDTDCVINYKKILEMIDSYSSEDHLYAGNCACKEHFSFKRDTDPPRSAIPPGYLLPCYSYGAGYVLPMKDIPSLMIATRHLDILLINEDINIGKAWNLLGRDCLKVEDWLLKKPNDPDIQKYYIIHTKGNYSLVKEYYDKLKYLYNAN